MNNDKTITTQVTLNTLQLFALIDAIESVHIENQTPEQIKTNDELIPILEEALDQIDSLKTVHAIADIVFN